MFTSRTGRRPGGRPRWWLLLGALTALAGFAGIPGTRAAASAPFITVCGVHLCDGGQLFDVRGATAYGQYANPDGEIALAQRAHINVLELVEFDSRFHQLSDVESDATWTRVDQFVAAAGAAGIHVILHVAEYGQSLEASGQIAERVDWGPYLQFIANRVNTVTGVRYADDPTIAMLELFGEIPMPDGQGTNGTPQDMQAFFQRSLAEWHSYAPHILGSSGGFSYLNLYKAGDIPWQAVMSDPNNATCDVEVNSDGDRNVSVPMVSRYCQGMGKPWFLAAWSSCLAPSAGSWDIDHWPSDNAMAAHAADMESVAHDDQPAAPAPSMAAIGSDFWNLASTTAHSGSCDIGPQFPLTLAAVQAAYNGLIVTDGDPSPSNNRAGASVAALTSHHSGAPASHGQTTASRRPIAAPKATVSTRAVTLSVPFSDWLRDRGR